jgi:2-polyprenyl-6-methoxyphenol hydroxylase-like FAD-dependent oxidoreductase
MNERILISGASIAGLTLAHWLARYGFHPTVVESAPHLRAGGNGVDVRDQAIDVVERMGIMSQVRAAAYDHRDVEQHKRLVSDAFANETSWRIKELLAAALADPDFYFDALSQVHMQSWFSGRTALAGDAAWCASPASGGGAELALVGAYRLAGELAAAGGDHRVAFSRYQNGHRDLVHKKQQIATNVRLMVPRTAGGKWIRNTFARLPLMRLTGAMERLTGANRVGTLPEYPIR